MANKSPEEKWAEYLRKHPNASDDRIGNYLRTHGRVAYWLGQQTAAPAPAAETATASNLVTTPAADTGIDFPDPEPTTLAAGNASAAAADTRPGWQRAWNWLKGNPISLTADPAYAPLYEKFNLGLWATAVGLLAWLLLRKKHR